MKNKSFMSKKNVTVKVYDSEETRFESMPCDFNSFLKWVDWVKQSVPEEFRKTARVDIEARQDYDGYIASVEVSYVRPETEDEYSTRLKEEQRLHKKQEDQDLRTFLKLKQKFGDI